MRCIIVIALCLMGLLALTAVENAQGVCLCIPNYDPVCGSDGNTYSNACMLKCAAESQGSTITVAYPGLC